MSDSNIDDIENDPEIEALLRELDESDLEMAAPPADLWSRIESAVGPIEESSPTGGAEPSNVISLDSRRRTLPMILAAAAAVVVLGGLALSLLGDDATSPLSRAELAYDPAAFDPLGADAVAEVSLIDEDGSFLLQIDESDLPTAEEADLEVWLIQPDADGNVADLVSLGTIDPDDPASLQVPATHDPDVYFVVDISVEPHDGDPTHSGRSILRGPLVEA